MFSRRRKKDTRDQKIVTNLLPVTIWVDRSDTRATQLLDDALHHATETRRGPHPVMLGDAEAMALRQILTDIMTELGPHIKTRKDIRDINIEPELNFAIGAYHATEKIRTIIDHMVK